MFILDAFVLILYVIRFCISALELFIQLNILSVNLINRGFKQSGKWNVNSDNMYKNTSNVYKSMGASCWCVAPPRGGERQKSELIEKGGITNWDV